MDRPSIADTAKILADYVRSVDNTRPVTAAANGVSDQKDAFFSALDVCGYNYEKDKYVSDHQRKPNRIMVATESFPLEQFDYWMHVVDHPWVIGDFVWTGFDYIGEPTPWHNEENLGAPSTSSYFGIIDSAGLKKNDFYFYQSQWLDKTTNPMVKILPHWNFEDKKLLKSLGTDLKREDNLIPVRVYSNLIQPVVVNLKK